MTSWRGVAWRATWECRCVCVCAWGILVAPPPIFPHFPPLLSFISVCGCRGHGWLLRPLASTTTSNTITTFGPTSTSSPTCGPRTRPRTAGSNPTCALTSRPPRSTGSRTGPPTSLRARTAAGAKAAAKSRGGFDKGCRARKWMRRIPLRR